MFGLEIDIPIYVAVAIGLFIATTRFALMPLMKEYRKERKRNQSVEETADQQLNAKNLGHYGASEIAKYLDSARPALQEAQKLLAEQKATGASPETLKPLQDRISMLETVIKYEQPIRMANQIFTKPLIGRLANGVLGQFL